MEMSASLASIYGGPQEYAPTVYALFDEVLRHQSDNTAVIAAHQSISHLSEFKKHPLSLSEANSTKSSPPCLNWTFRQLHNAAVQLVFSLKLQGVNEGSMVIALIPNGVEWAILFWASFVGKFTLCCIDPGALLPARAQELQGHLQRLRPDAIFVADQAGSDAIDAALQSHVPRCKVTLQQSDRRSESCSTQWLRLTDLAQPTLHQAEIDEIEKQALKEDLHRLGSIHFTSGTSVGKPKGCPHTIRELLHCSTHGCGNHPPGPPRRLQQLANFRILSVVVSLGAWRKGGAVVFPAIKFSPQAMLKALNDESFAVSSCIMVPAQLHAVVAEENFSTVRDQIAKRRTLKTLALLGDMMTKELYQKACKAFPGTQISCSYGMTEASPMTMWPIPYRTVLEDLPVLDGMVPVGKPSRGTRFKIVASNDDDDKTAASNGESYVTLQKGEKGELHMSNPGLIQGYLDGVGASNFYTDETGHRWFKTGDLAVINDDDWVFVLGRKKDIIKRAGVPITPAMIEGDLDAYLNSQTSVIGVAHPTLGQEPYAVVDNMSGKSKADVKQHVTDMFGPDYAMGDVLALSELGLSEFPLNATGKILKRELLERIDARHVRNGDH